MTDGAHKSRIGKLRPGDWVVYRKTKFSPSPGPRAKEIAPFASGDLYSYVVEKLWVVVEVLPDGRLRLRTRRGKEHVFPANDPNLRPARWWEKWLYRDRFRDAAAASPTESASAGGR